MSVSVLGCQFWIAVAQQRNIGGEEGGGGRRGMDVRLFCGAVSVFG